MYKKKRNSRNIWGYVFLSPMIVYMSVFLLVPFLTAISNSFKSFDAIDKYRIQFKGFDNWIQAVTDKLFWTGLGNVVYSQVLFISVSFVIAMITAIMLSSSKKLDSVFRTIYFLPVITSITVGMMIFNILIGPTGPVVSLLLKLGIIDNTFIWTFSKSLPMPLIALFSSWKWFGVQMVIFIGGIASIDQTIYEAANIDGAGQLTQIFRITLPLLKEQIKFVLTMNIINGLQMFAEVFMYFDTLGGAHHSALTPVLYLYHIAFKKNDFGYASTIGLLLAFIIFIVTILQMKITGGGMEDA